MKNTLTPDYVHKAPDPVTDRFFHELKNNEFEGDIDSRWSARLSMATDNSIYSIIPAGVLFPKSKNDLDRIFKLAGNQEFTDLTFSPRGGGTGTNGQSLNTGIIIDSSRYMKKILEINVEKKWVHVEAGVVLDQLNDALKSSGLFFAPSLSPSNRATLGGMINTDASGKGSRLYGKTSNHILELTCHLVNGTSFTSKSLLLENGFLPDSGYEFLNKISNKISSIVNKNRELIDKIFPRMDRFLTGYNLLHVKSDRSFNLNSLIAGSEGTLCFVSSAKLKLTEIPKSQKLIVLKYPDTDSALKSADGLLQHNPSAIETVDYKIINQAKSIIKSSQILDFLFENQNEARSCINLVEFTGTDQNTIREKIDKLLKSQASTGVTATYVTKNKFEAGEFWLIRKKGVELLSAIKGAKKPTPFIEDTAVPPDRAADYISELEAILKSEGLEYGLFGHLDAGCIHIRPNLDMQDPEDEIKVRRISDKVVKLVKKYGGLIWGEHGKGFRSEYSPEFFGEKLYAEIRIIKGLFDPDNRMNPGKIATPPEFPSNLYSLESPTIGQYDRKVPRHRQREYKGVMDCNGNGLCYHYDSHNIMCPTYHQSSDRLASPRGRAILMKEWLRTSEMDTRSPEFLEDIFKSMDGCISCKACTTQCPVGVNISESRSRFLNDYYHEARRPFRDYLLAYSENLLIWSRKINRLLPGLNILLKFLVNKTPGLVDLPFSVSNADLDAKISKLPGIGYHNYDIPVDPKKGDIVILYTDPVTQILNQDLVWNCYELLTKLGFYPVLLRDFPSGKPLHLKGFLGEFKNQVNKNLPLLNNVGKKYPVIAIEPGTGLCLREEYREYGKPEFEVLLIQEFLSTHKEKFKPSGAAAEKYYLLNHCHESAMLNSSGDMWADLFSRCGKELISLESSCCGMAGAFGHEKKHQKTSELIFRQSWQPQIKKSGKNILVTGYSCKSQVRRFENFSPGHPVEILNSNTVQIDN